ncbi:hypothetical protein BCR35DRAFT_304067 [Leucosporidium creatinivorum]|uniref:Uncharacterized protein n=1 Tax=Leucosporidium creatinivorum TaxID=106004 RepID=A0A1Y2FBD0_9BASI|nr:hypothetical protein BCR35DRAFT_304067 [Leucosporidium creatinivorum]
MFKDSPDPKLTPEDAELDNLLEQGSPDPNGWERAPAPRSRGKSGGWLGLGRMFGAVLALIVLVALAGVVGGLTGTLPSSLSNKLRFTNDAPPVVQRILIRPQTNDEGLGSVLQRLKGSIILAEVVSNATFILGEAESEHHYSTSRLFNARYFNSSLPLGKSCVLGHYLPWDQRTALMQAACAVPEGGEEPAEVLTLRQRLAPCHIILDDIPDELYEGFNGCIRPFVRERLGGIAERRLGRQRKLSVGIHIRWGDTANPEGGMVFRGSMDIVHINNIVRDARERFGPLDIKLVMENHDSMVLDHLNFGDYDLIDTGDSVADLKVLANNDLLLLGASSYGATAHLLAPPGLTIVEGGDDIKYKDTVREAVLIPQYRPESLDALKRILEW